MDFLKELKEYAPLLTILSSALIAFYIAYYNQITPIRKERFLKVISPFFYAIENYLFNDTALKENPNKLIELKNIINDNREYAGCYLKYLFDNYEINKDKKSYILLCNFISNEFDYLSKILHFPKRSLKYKLNKRQYSNKISLWISTIVFWVIFIFLLLALIIAFVFFIFMILLIIDAKLNSNL